MQGICTPHKRHDAAGNVPAAVAELLVNSAYLGANSNGSSGTSAEQLAHTVTSSKLSTQDQAAAFAQALQQAENPKGYNPDPSLLDSTIALLKTAAESAHFNS